MDSLKVIFKNPTAVDIRAVKTMGVNVKETENPIGYFGTGLKYAIAVLLREKQKVRIFSGLDEFVFNSREVEIRGEKFNIVTLEYNEQVEELGYTTDLGKKWKLWCAYRELYSNCIDEGGDIFISALDPTPQEDVTFVIIEGSDFLQTHYDRGEFILDRSTRKMISCTDLAEVYAEESTHVFYRGISVGYLPTGGRAAFTYNILRPITLTEDRTYEYGWQIKEMIGQIGLNNSNRSFVKKFVNPPKDTFEGKTDFDWYGVKLSPEAAEVVGQELREGASEINSSIEKLYKEQVREQIEIEVLVLDSFRLEQLHIAIQFSRKIGYPVDDYPIVPVRTLGEGIYGRADDDNSESKILVSEKSFLDGTKILAATLIEEYIHLRYKYDDLSHALQDHLFQKLVSLGEQYVWGEPL